jgi:hypothetical protein
MKQCDRIGDLFLDIHDDRMDGETEKLVREHLHNCTNCREDFKWYGITVQALANLEEVGPPTDFLTQLNARLYPVSPPLITPIRDFLRNLFTTAPYLPLPAGVAALSFIAVVGFMVYNQAPVEVSPEAGPRAVQEIGGKSSAAARLAAQGAGILTRDRMQTVSKFPVPSQSHPSSPPATLPSYSAATPPTLEKEFGIPGTALSAMTDEIGADSLTVESPRMDTALESLKKMLPRIDGRLVDEKARGGKIVVGVLIPSAAYGSLTTELVNHGAVAVGAEPDVAHQGPFRTEGNNVLLYIRFMNSR